jgi:glycine oxidase
VSPDVIVIGGGVVGGCIAYELAKAGARVVVCDREAMGQASRASAGMLAPLSEAEGPGPFLDLGLESLRLHRPLADELLERTGIDVGYRTSGLLRVALSEADEVAVRRRRSWHMDAGFSVPWLDAVRARDAEPALSQDIRGAAYYEGEHQVSAPLLTQAALRAAADLGATLRMGLNVEGLLVSGSTVQGVRAAGEQLRAGEVVVAAGAWSGAFADLGPPLPVRPVRGQLVALRTQGTGLRHMIYSSGGYLNSKSDGLTLVGSTQEEVGFDPRSTADGVAKLLQSVARLTPALSAATFSHALVGLRPGSPDGLPLIGRLPGWSGISVASGHFRNGILLAPITAILITDVLRHGRPRRSLEPFDPARVVVQAA